MPPPCSRPPGQSRMTRLTLTRSRMRAPIPEMECYPAPPLVHELSLESTTSKRRIPPHRQTSGSATNGGDHLSKVGNRWLGSLTQNDFSSSEIGAIIDRSSMPEMPIPAYSDLFI